MSTIFVRGPFSRDEMARIIEVIADIETTRPSEVFEVFIDDEAVSEVNEFLAKVSPLRPGYERVLRYTHIRPADA